MDINLTYAALRTPMEVNLTYAPYPTPSSGSLTFWTSALGIALVGGMFLALGALIAGGSQILLERRKDKVLKRNNRIQAHNDLLGLKHKLVSYYKNYLISRINEENLYLHSSTIADKSLEVEDLKDKQGKKITDEKANILIVERKKAQPDYIESKRMRERAEKLELEKVNVDVEFWKTIGQILTLFSDQNDLIKNLVNNIETTEKNLDKLKTDIAENFKIFHTNIKTASNILIGDVNQDKCKKFHDEIEKIDVLRDNETNSLVSRVESEEQTLSSQIDILLETLKNQVWNEANAESWWRFWK